MTENNKKWNFDLEKLTKFFHDLFVKNIQTKLIVFLITLIIWSYTMLRNEYTTKMNVPFQVENISEGKVLKENLPAKVTANFKGDGLDFFFLLFQSKSSFRLTLDLSTIKWFYNFKLNSYYEQHPENVILPKNSDVELINIIEPESLYVELDNQAQKRIPVRSQVSTSLAPGYTKYEMTIEPDSVTIAGPKSYIKEIKYINTKKVEMQKVTSTIKTTVDLQGYGRRNITIEPEQVEISQLVDQIGEKVISGVPVEIKNPPPQGSLDIQPNKVTVYIAGGFNKIKNIDVEDLNVKIDLQRERSPDKKYYEPTIEGLPDHLEVNRIEPAQIEIRFIEEGD